MGASAMAVIDTIGSTFASAGTAVASGAEAIGIPSAIAAPVGAGVTSGLDAAAQNAGVAALTGGNVGKAAESGFVGGGIGGALSPAFGGVLGQTGGTIAADALGGAAGSALTGGNAVSGALQGGIRGALTAPGSPLAPKTGGASGPGVAAPASVAAPSGDVTNGFDPYKAPGVAGGFGASTGGMAGLPGGIGSGAAGGPAATLPGTETNGIQMPSSYAPGAHIDAFPHTATAGALPHDGGISGVLSGAGDFLKKNPLVGVEAAAMGANMIMGNQPPKFERQLESMAGREAAQGNLMEGYLSSGTLPPGMQAGLTAASRDAEASIRSKYASLGQSGSSAEAQDLAAVQERMAAQGATIATQLYQQGASDMQISEQLYATLMGQAMQQDQAFAEGIGNFSSALATMGRPSAG